MPSTAGLLVAPLPLLMNGFVRFLHNFVIEFSEINSSDSPGCWYWQGIIWVWGESGPLASLESQNKEPNLIDELENPLLKGKISPIKWSQYNLMYGWDHYFENALDPAHVVVAHHGTFGR